MKCKDCPAFQGTYETEMRILNPNDCSCGITLQKVMPHDEYAEECIARELLEGLRWAMHYVEGYLGVEGRNKKERECLEKARAAIKKAGGGSCQG